MGCYLVKLIENFRKLSVLVLSGGPSAERKISLASGRAVVKALKLIGHKVIESDIDPDDLTALDTQGIDVVFPVLHGTFGEDGQLQVILEERKLRFVGSDSAGSRLAMNKYEAKKIFHQAGVRTAKSFLVRSAEPGSIDSQAIIRAVATVGVPCVIKPNCQGSSIGVVIARQEVRAIEAIEDVLLQHGDCLVEQFIRGREFTVGILAGEVLPVLEVKAAEGFYDFAAKYEKNDTEYRFDLGLPDRVIKSMQDDGLKCFKAAGCRDLGRVDFILSDSEEAYVLEVNTMPGFTESSLVPKAAGRVGMSIEEICDKVVQIAYARPK